MRSYRLLIAALAMLAIGIVGLLAVPPMLASSQGVGQGPVADGARIYYTATDSAGRPITYRGGMMMGMACANCHGPDGHGLATPMFVSPNITYKNLTDPGGMVETDGSREGVYTDETIKRTITQGIDSEGNPLQWPMPRWRMSDGDLNNLIEFLKTLP